VPSTTTCSSTAAWRANAKVAENLFWMATNPTPSRPTVTAAIFWAKTHMGWREDRLLGVLARQDLDRPLDRGPALRVAALAGLPHPFPCEHLMDFS
jgi:hypothetical protein